MAKFLKLTDKDGDPLYIKNDVIAIYTSTERTTISSMHDPSLRVTKQEPEIRTVVSQSSGGWPVTDTYEEILKRIAEADECE